MIKPPGKILIIGGGIAGLCAGVFAQSCGYEAVIIEAENCVGGLATSWRRGDYRFETCLHWLLGSNPESEMYHEWGEVFDIDKVSFVNFDEFGRWESEQSETLRIFSDVDKLEEELLQKAPADAEEIKRFTSAIRRFTDLPMPEPDSSVIHQGLAMLRMAPLLPLFQRWSGASASEYGQRFSNHLLRRFFSEGATGRMSALALALPLSWMNGRNAGYAIGGARSIIELIEKRFTSLGGVIRTNARVDKIIVEDDTVVGVRLATGELIKGDWVISGADGRSVIYDMLDGKYKNEAIDDLYKRGETFPSYVQVSLGVAQDLSQEPPHVSRVLKAPLQLDPETALNVVSFRILNFDPTLAPPGKTSVTCFLPTYNHAYWVGLHDADKAGYEKEKIRVADEVIAILDRRTAGLRGCVETIDVSTPASVIRHTGNWKGSMEGWLLMPRAGYAPMRQTLPGLDRFLMVGHWIQPGGGLPAGLMTARMALKSICRRDGVAFTPERSGGGTSKAA
ncbi:MAG: phytoene desaturase family protein [Parvularculaceae bacterium]